MSFANILNFSNMSIFVIWVCIFLFFNIFGFISKKSFFNLITLLLSLSFLVIHIVLKNKFITVFSQNIIVDFVCIIISIALYIFVDEIEARREVISEVFENKYKKRRKK